MDEQKTMMFAFNEDKPRANTVIREVGAAGRLSTFGGSCVCDQP